MQNVRRDISGLFKSLFSLFLLSIFSGLFTAKMSLAETTLPDFCERHLKKNLSIAETGELPNDVVTDEVFPQYRALAESLTIERLQNQYPGASAEELQTIFEREGYFGPNSATWEVHRIHPAFLTLRGLDQLYLDLADPVGAAGVAKVSERIRNNVVLRLFLTRGFLQAMAFGTKEKADYLSSLMFRIHSHVSQEIGEKVGHFNRPDFRFVATSARSLAWVAVTHDYANWITYQTIMIDSGRRRTTPQEFESLRARFFAESKIRGLLYGVPPEMMPGSYEEVLRFFKTFYTSGYLAYSDSARKIEANVREQIRAFENLPVVGRVVATQRWFLDQWTRRNFPEQAEGILGEGRMGLPELSLTGGLAVRAFDYAAGVSVRVLPEVLFGNPFYRAGMARVRGQSPNMVDSLVVESFDPRNRGRHRRLVQQHFDDYYPNLSRMSDLLRRNLPIR